MNESMNEWGTETYVCVCVCVCVSLCVRVGGGRGGACVCVCLSVSARHFFHRSAQAAPRPKHLHCERPKTRRLPPEAFDAMGCMSITVFVVVLILVLAIILLL